MNNITGTHLVVATIGTAYIIACAIKPALLWLSLVALVLVFG